MKKGVEAINLDSDLRRHLLFGFIGLVVAVLSVFIYVTHNIATDLGVSLESEHIQTEMHEISETINDYVHAGKLHTVNVEQELHDYFRTHHYLVDDDVIFFKARVANNTFNVTQANAFNAISEMNAVILEKTSDQGVAELDGGSFFWFYLFNKDNDSEVILVRKVSAFDRAIDYMTTRLSISAFVTFWLAVWAALIISAFITKRFIKGNVRLNYLANHDSLTNLPNRSYLYEIVNRFFQQRKNKVSNVGHKKASMLLIDLNKFKMINDTMGHHIGDVLLTSIASRLNKFVSNNTYAFRYGGDEFIIWSENTDNESAEILAEKVIESCRKLLHIRGSQFEMSVSIGIATYPEDGKNFNDIFKHADIAMYHAKRMRLGYQSYQKSLDFRSSLKVNLSGQLNQALTNDQFVLHYQPKVDINNGKIFGVEALVRWQHPVEGLLAPNMFITIIEQSDFVHVFTRYIFKQAMSQCAKWLKQGLYLNVAVNLSPYNLLDGGLITFLKEQLSIHKIPPELIEIELTESATMVDIEVTKKVFKQFRELGLKLSIDDFGTGMSSLSYIKQLPVDFIKIDRSFIINIDTDIEDEAIVMSILLLCKKLNRKVIVEGIETLEQRDKLISLGCEFAQGYYFSKPVPAEQLVLN